MDQFGWGSTDGPGGMLGGQVLQTRTILLFGELTTSQAQTVGQQLLLLARSPGDIKLVLSSQSGPAEAGEALFDLLRGISAPVRVIGAGAVAEAAALVFAAPPLAQRGCLPHARFSLHQRLGPVGQLGQDVVTEAFEVARRRERLDEIFARQTGQPLAAIERDTERPVWLSAEEAVAYGLVGRIVQSMDEV